jgi:hypothetical protein
MLNIDCLRYTCHVCQVTKKEREKYGLLPPKIAESDTVTLFHCLYESGGSIYNKDTSQTHSLLTLTMIDPAEYHWLV